ncbi:MAG: hypothetical protein KME12_09635 [Trichocoleus desertorum ATA4-8-CV12]|jgi:O-antigen/teichoic acid export membrane protein|nr:hypothetical protein [Trichocoleus desertorum ATA4-8-CV12]
MYWIKKLSHFVSIQILVQILSTVSGLILIRTLNKEDYAYFTIANSMQGAINGLADSGVSIGLSAIGGKVWQDQYQFGQLINTAMQLRQWFALAATIIITPIMFWMLISNHASITYTILIVVAILIELHFYLEIAVLGTIPRFQSNITLLQSLDLFIAISRLTLLGTAYLIYLNAAVAAFISTVASCLKSFLLRRAIHGKIDAKAEVSLVHRQYIFNIVKKYFPNTIYSIIQGQIFILLISIFGSTQNVAEIGALGRFSIIFSLINSVMASIVYPAFSRCQDVDLLRRRYWGIVVGNLAFACLLTAFSLLFATQILWVIGSKYYDLKGELVLAVILGSLTNVGGVIWGLCCARGWIENMWMDIPLKIGIQIILLLSLDVSSTQGVLVFGIFSAIPSVFLMGWIANQGLKIKLE